MIPHEGSKKLFKGAFLLTAGQIAGSGLNFIRNVILARLLTKADYGMASAFAMTISLFELAGRMAIGRQIIQSPDGDSEDFQRCSHAFQFMAGLVSAVVLAGLSVPMASMFKAPNAAWAFAWLAFVPLCKGLEHLDNSRQMRHLEYLPGVLCDIIPQLIITILAWPLASSTGDFRIVLWLILGKAGLSLLMSHYLARRPYRWGFNLQRMRGILAFSGPLLINGFIMFGSQQGDQMLIGSAFSLGALASYSAAVSIVLIPLSMCAQVSGTLMLPVFARCQSSHTAFVRQYVRLMEISALLSALILVPLIVAGDQIVVLVCGDKFKGAGGVMAWLGVASALRFLRFATATAALARGDTMNQVIANLCRIVNLPLALVALYAGGQLEAVAACAAIGELAALAVSIYRLRCNQGMAISHSIRPCLFVAGFLFVSCGTVFLGSGGWSRPLVGVAAALFVAVAVGFARALFPQSVAQLRETVVFQCGLVLSARR